MRGLPGPVASRAGLDRCNRPGRYRQASCPIRSLAALAAILALSAVPAAATGLRASYAIDAAGITVLALTAALDVNEGAYAVGITSSTRGVAAILIRGYQASQVDGAWRAAAPAPLRYRTDGFWRGIGRHTELHYERGQPVVRVLDPPEPEVRFPVPPEQQRNTTDPLSAFAQLVRQVRDSGRCDGVASIFDGRLRIEFTVSTEGTEHLDGGRNGWSGDALRCAYESRIVAGFRRDQDPAEAVRPERGTAWIAAPAPGMLPIPVRIDGPNRWFGSITIRLIHVETLPAR